MYIRHNISALNTQRQFNMSNKKINKHTKKLATSSKINRSADDATGLAISEKMRAKISELSKASKNTQDNISLLQTGEGTLAEINSILIRGRELAIQSINDTNTDSNREKIEQEFTSLLEEIDNIGTSTEFNTMKLFDGSKKIILQLGANESQNQTIFLPEISRNKLGLSNTNVKMQQSADQAIKVIDEAVKEIFS